MGLLQTINQAVNAWTGADAELSDEPGATASILTEATAAGTGDNTMTTQTPAPGGASQTAGISEADHTSAVEAAKAEGHAAGFAAANTRLAAILGADGVKADGKRMAAALDLAIQSPGMAAEGVTAFVTANVGATEAAKPAQTYEQNRLAAAALAQSGTGGQQQQKSGLSALVDGHIASLKR
jgi:hypothetical protein